MIPYLEKKAGVGIDHPVDNPKIPRHVYAAILVQIVFELMIVEKRVKLVLYKQTQSIDGFFLHAFWQFLQLLFELGMLDKLHEVR
jgi:hypothetical protein